MREEKPFAQWTFAEIEQRLEQGPITIRCNHQRVAVLEKSPGISQERSIYQIAIHRLRPDGSRVWKEAQFGASLEEVMIRRVFGESVLIEEEHGQ